MSDVTKTVTETVVAIQSVPVSSTTPTTGQILQFNGTEYVPTIIPAPSFSSPTNISGLVLWLRADMGVTLSGSDVTNWNDQSGIADSNRNVATTGNSPTFISGNVLYNNQPTIAFDASSTQGLVSGTWSPSYNEPYTIIVVGDCGNTNGVFIGVNNTVLSAPILRSDAGNFSLYNGNAALEGTSGITASPVVFYAEFNEPNNTIRVSQNTPQATGAMDDNDSVGGINMSLGFFYYGEYLNGNIAEVIVFDGILGFADRTSLQNYLSVRYGIPIGA